MEKAVFLKNHNQIKKIKSFDRIYYGEECCFRKFPTIKNFKEVIKNLEGKHLTIVTPMITQNNLELFKKILGKLAILCKGSELVFNDWGTYRIITKKRFKFTLSLGRLLTKQKSDPRLYKLKKEIPIAGYNYMRKNILCNKYTRDYLKKNKVLRAEVDNVLFGQEEIDDFSFSLHYPKILVSVSRMCIDNKRNYTIKKACNFECDEVTYKLKKPSFPKDIMINGRMQYYLNNNYFKNLKNKNIDRIVFNDPKK